MQGLIKQLYDVKFVACYPCLLAYVFEIGSCTSQADLIVKDLEPPILLPYFSGAGILGRHHHVHFMAFWGSIPGLRVGRQAP